MLFYLLAFSALARAADYQCRTEFGETLPLRSGKVAWNESARTRPGPAKVKQKNYEAPAGPGTFETRYVTQAGPSFGLIVVCPPGEKCRGAFAGGAETLLLGAPLLDERAPGTGRAELKLTNREHLNLLVRLRKIPAGAGAPLSSSGELKIFREDPLFIQDVGVDDFFAPAPGASTRLAAFEIKIRCRRSGAEANARP